MKTWAARVRVELLIDDQLVGSHVTTVGQLAHIDGLDAKSFERSARTAVKGSAKVIAKQNHLLEGS